MPRATDGDLRRTRKSRRSRAAKELPESSTGLEGAAQKVQPKPSIQEQYPNAQPLDGNVAGNSTGNEKQNTTHIVRRGKAVFRTKGGGCLFESYYEEFKNGPIMPDNHGGHDLPPPARRL